jgi:hypothetical protein
LFIFTNNDPMLSQCKYFTYTNSDPMLCRCFNTPIPIMIQRWADGNTFIPTMDLCWADASTLYVDCLKQGQRWANATSPTGYRWANINPTRLVERWADEQDDVGPTHKTDNGPTQMSMLGLRWPNVRL